MKKIKRILQMDLENIKISYNKEKLFIFTLTFLTSIIVHFQLYALMITGPDTLINSMYHQADIWETMLLRFGLYFVQLIKGNIVSPVLVTLISSAILSGTVIVVIEIYHSFSICSCSKYFSNTYIFLLFRCVYIRIIFSNVSSLFSK